ncbi:Rop family plasmid primer RNA-binding protein [Escherichia coli]|nr:Rop family plasmid primer RNA-binding protein [Escherichia coli]
MNKQQQAVLNMAGFIKSQSLTLLEKLDALDADEQAAMCEKLHELAEELQNSIQTRMQNGIEERKEKMSHKALFRFLAH